MNRKGWILSIIMKHDLKFLEKKKLKILQILENDWIIFMIIEDFTNID